MRIATTRVLALIVAAGLAATIGCGGRKQESAESSGAASGSSSTKESAPSTLGGLAQMAKGIEQMGKAAQEMSKNVDQKPVDPVDFKQLVALLPDVGGWEKTEPEGERMTSPVGYSQAKCTYKKGESSIDAEITDSGFNQMLVAPMIVLMSGFSRESTSGYEKGTTVAGNPAYEKWDKKAKDAELTVLVNKRFIYTLKGRDIDDPKAVQEIAGKTDLKKLASLH